MVKSCVVIQQIFLPAKESRKREQARSINRKPLVSQSVLLRVEKHFQSNGVYSEIEEEEEEKRLLRTF